METVRNCAFNVSRNVLLSEQVTEVSEDLEPLQVAALLLNGPAIDPQSSVWLKCIGGKREWPRLFAFDVAYLGANETILEIASVGPGTEFPALHEGVTSVLFLPDRRLEETNSTRGNVVRICAKTELEAQIESPSHSSPGLREATMQAQAIQNQPEASLSLQMTGPSEFVFEPFVGSLLYLPAVVPAAAQSTEYFLTQDVMGKPRPARQTIQAHGTEEVVAEPVRPQSEAEELNAEFAALEESLKKKRTGESEVPPFFTPAKIRFFDPAAAAETREQSGADVEEGSREGTEAPEEVVSRPSTQLPPALKAAILLMDEQLRRERETQKERRRKKDKTQGEKKAPAKKLARQVEEEATQRTQGEQKHPSAAFETPTAAEQAVTQEAEETPQAPLQSAPEFTELPVVEPEPKLEPEFESEFEPEPQFAFELELELELEPEPEIIAEPPVEAPVSVAAAMEQAIAELRAEAPVSDAAAMEQTIAEPHAEAPWSDASVEQTIAEMRAEAPVSDAAAMEQTIGESPAEAPVSEAAAIEQTIAEPPVEAPVSVAAAMEQAIGELGAEAPVSDAAAMEQAVAELRAEAPVSDTAPMEQAIAELRAEAPVSDTAAMEQAIAELRAEAPVSDTAPMEQTVAQLPAEAPMSAAAAIKETPPALETEPEIEQIEQEDILVLPITPDFEQAPVAAALEAATQPVEQRPAPVAEPREIPKPETAHGTTPEAKKEKLSFGLRLQRWLLGGEGSHQRRSERITLPGLVAFYWSGGAPKPHEVVNISKNGFYLRTKELWSLDTLVRMVLEKPNDDKGEKRQSINVLARVVRIDESGVGHEFVTTEALLNRRSHDVLPEQGTSRKELDRFLGLH